MLRVHALFGRSELAVIGLHSVFEHHAVVNPAEPQVFMKEHRLEVPIGIDEAGAQGAIPTPAGDQRRVDSSTPSADNDGCNDGRCAATEARKRVRRYFGQPSFNAVMRLNTGVAAEWSMQSATK